MVLQIFVVLLLFSNYWASNVIAFKENGPKSLYGTSDPPAGGQKTYIFNAEELGPSNRNKRDVPAAIPNPPPVVNSNVTTKLNHLNDTHKQLMVHWVGEGSNVIICLARDQAPASPLTPPNPSAVYISYNYGDDYENKTESFKMDNGNYSTVEKFYNHPKYNTHFIFTDIINNLLFVTTNHGRNITKIPLYFTPHDISFLEYQPQKFLVYDKSNSLNKLWLTETYGKTWRLIQEFVKSYFWMQDEKSQQQLIVQRIQPSNLTIILYSNNLFAEKDANIYATSVKDLYIKGDYIFTTKEATKNNYNLYVSYKLGKKLQCIFDTDLDLKAFHIIDVTGNRAFIAVSHSDTISHLYVSENLGGRDDKVRFTLSLESVLCYFPNSTWHDSWLHHVTDDAFADVYKVEGLSGIYIASQIASKPIGNNLGPHHLVSRITYDHGGSWRPLNPPQKDVEGQLISCAAENNCSLHLSQRFSQLNPETRSISILTSKSAPGIIIATGVIGKSLKGHFGVFISTDAGITWRQSLRELYFFNMGDHGGILTAVKYYKLRGDIRHVLYSTDEGENWMETEFHNEDIRLYGLMTEPGENTTVFTMFGSLPAQHQWIIVKLDMQKVFKHNCTKDDYKPWSPSQSDENHRYVHCMLGQELTYTRRIPHVNCYNGLDFDLPTTMKPCDCDGVDYECDFGFLRTGKPWHCIRNKSLSEDPFVQPSYCHPGQSYNRTKGYRKISGDKCIGGFEKHYLPDNIPCSYKHIPEVVIFAQRERIVRVSILEKKREQLQIPNLKNVIAIDYDIKSDCVYWADIVSDTIGRQCLHGVSPVEILVSNDLVSIEGMALDWISRNLYFVDGLRAKIELIRTDIDHSGRMRRTILNSSVLKKPRGIVVHPTAGYMFWTDWSTDNPSVNRANLDGSNIIQIARKPVVEWPNGISIDHIAERVYWVDAREDYIGSTDLQGRGFKKIPIDNEFVSHPFAVAVFKDDVYWDDWKRAAIFFTDKDHGGHVNTLATNLSGLMDLKIFADNVQSGMNPCSKNPCPSICVGAPKTPFFSCLCPDGMEYKKNEGDLIGKCLCPGGVEPFKNSTCPKMGGTCSVDYYQCGNGVCIPKGWRCDMQNDCGDNSDELQCGIQTCAPNYFVCGDGKCLPHYWRCDYETDCADGSDENNCPKQNCTSGNQFTCANGRCISMRWKCDGEDDCRDGSDEKDCTRPEPSSTCKVDEFKCESGGLICIPSTWRCDGENDCKDNSDEIGCDNNTCSEFQFSCGGPSHKCIYKSWVCDGDKDCETGLDEQNCTNIGPNEFAPGLPPKNPFLPVNGTVCHDWMFTCTNKKCVPYWWKCDGADDCEDSSDEQGCGYLSTTPATPTFTPMTLPHVCPQNQFQCESGDCIAMAWVCDKTNDCLGGEDESHCQDATACDPEQQFKCKMDGSCISITAVCDERTDCPDGSDETFCAAWHNFPSGPATPSCSIGYFPCDVNSCWPLAALCDEKEDCRDGFDEMSCSTNSRVYQVLQMGVDERGVNSSSLLLYWWMPVPEVVTLEFMPSISTVRDGVWKNKTWSPSYEFRYNDLKPYTKYNITVYVRINGSDEVFPPAKYFIASTSEGTPSEPWNVTVQQQNGSDILVQWERPLHPNGPIQTYEICWSPPLIKLRLNDNRTSHTLTADFEPDVKYSFYVIAYNRIHQSQPSEIKSLIFDGESEMDYIRSLSVVNSSNHSVSLSWEYRKQADGFIIDVEAKQPYPMLQPRLTYTKNITITNLAPGVHYTFRVKAYKSMFVGPEYSLVVLTEGKALPEVYIVHSSVIKEVGTSVKLTWNRPKDSRKINWVYGIYYGLTEEDLLEKSRQNTTDQSITVQHLDACEQYIFAVAILGPNGVGPLSRHPPTVATYMNRLAPPKRLYVEKDVDGVLTMLLQWSASCTRLQEPIGYIINVYDRVKKRSSTVSLSPTIAEDLTHKFNISFGGIYDIKVSANEEGARFTPIVTYRAPPLLPPFEVRVFPEANGSYVVYWQERIIPDSPYGHTYVVLVSEGDKLNETTASRYDIEKPPFIFTNNSADVYSFAVLLKTGNGYSSMLSEVASSTNKSLSWSQQIAGNNMSSILIPVCVLLVVLCGALGFYVFKYRRLQNSFSRFANSHYDTRSEAATFDDNGLEEDDSPQIRGFSDDEPLVIA